MPLKSRLSVEIPKTSLPSWLFGSPSAELSDAPIVLDPLDPDKRFISLSTYRRDAQRFAAGLRAHGFQTGDTLLYISGNSLAFFAVFMGTLMAGGIFSGANPKMTASQIAYQAKDANCTFMLSSSEAYKNCLEALQSIKIPAKVVYLVDREVLFDAPGRPTLTVPYHDWSELLEHESKSRDFDWNVYCTDPEQLAALNYTSGSTGYPKGVMTSHRNHIANAVQWIKLQEEHPDGSNRAAKTSWVGFMPMIYIFGQSSFLLIGPKRGIRNYLMEAFDLDTMVRLVEKYRTTELHATPATAIGLVKSPVALTADLTCLTSVQIGGAPLKQPICDKLAKQLGHPGLIVKQGWGMTELTGVPISRHPSDDTVSISVGELLPNCEGKVLSVDGESELGPNEKGEIAIRGPMIAQGYRNRPDMTRQTFGSDGWLRTGDLGYYGEDGKWFVIDRLRELIVTSKGHQIIPSEIESTLLDIDGVSDAGVVYAHVSEQSPKEPRAFVVLDQTAKLSVKEIHRILGEQLPESQQMTAGIFVVDKIPKLPGAKIDRVALRKVVVPHV